MENVNAHTFKKAMLPTMEGEEKVFQMCRFSWSAFDKTMEHVVSAEL